MLRAKCVAVVVPARNEELHIAEMVRGVPAWVDRVVVVDDGSTDATGRLATAEGASRPVDVLRFGESRGVGGAIVAGYRRAMEQGADVIAVMAGDGQMHPDDLEAVVGPVVDGHADYVKGNRLDHPEVLRTMPLHRLAASEVLSRLTGLAVGAPQLRDSQSGFTAVSVAALQAIDLDAVWPSYGYPNDLLAALLRAGCRAVDVVVRPVYRGEASGLRPWHLATIGFLIGRALARRWSAPPRPFPVSAPTSERTSPSPRDAQALPTTTETRPPLPTSPRPRPLST